MFLARGVDHWRVSVEARRIGLGGGHLCRTDEWIRDFERKLTPTLTVLLMAIGAYAMAVLKQGV